MSAKRTLPRWRTDPFRGDGLVASEVGGSGRRPAARGDGPEVALFADTFTTWFEPENARAAVRVLETAGFLVRRAAPPPGERRPLCCGRTFLAAGLVEEARRELARTFAALGSFIERGVPIVGLEPSCLLTFRDEALALGFGRETGDARFLLFEELVAGMAAEGGLDLPLRPLAGRRALLHGHCHQKAFGVMPALERTLRLVPELEVETIESSCCGMAGAFGYEAANFDGDGGASLLPAVRAADRDTLIVAGGTSCRHQVADGTGRPAWHVASWSRRSPEPAGPGISPLREPLVRQAKPQESACRFGMRTLIVTTAPCSIRFRTGISSLPQGTKTWLGERIVVWCNEDGDVCVAESVCPHLGSDLGPVRGPGA